MPAPRPLRADPDPCLRPGPTEPGPAEAGVIELTSADYIDGENSSEAGFYPVILGHPGNIGREGTEIRSEGFNLVKPL